MVEKLIRPIPQNVLDAKKVAKETGDTSLLSELARRGGVVAGKRRRLRKIEAERKARIATTRDLFADELLEEAREAELLAGAEQHAESNRIGWAEEE